MSKTYQLPCQFCGTPYEEYNNIDETWRCDKCPERSMTNTKPQQDTWEKDFEEKFVYTHQNGEWKTVSGRYTDIKDFIAQEKAISEQQGYQRGLQEKDRVHEIASELVSIYDKDVYFGQTEDMLKKIVELRKELRKKISEKMKGGVQNDKRTRKTD